jgi:hypothetical protein
MYELVTRGYNSKMRDSMVILVWFFLFMKFAIVVWEVSEKWDGIVSCICLLFLKGNFYETIVD